MPSTVIQKVGLRDLYDRNIKQAWMQGYGEPQHEFESIYDTIVTQNEDERSSYISGLGLWQQKTTRNVPYDTIYQGFDVTCTPATYWMAVTIDQETVEDDKRGLLGQQVATNMAQTGRETLEVLAAAPFNNLGAALSATSFSPWASSGAGGAGYLGDGVALLSVSHPILSGGVCANTPSPQVDISIAALQSARIAMAKVVNARGLQQVMKPTTLVVPEDSRWIARELLETPTTPYSPNLTVNVVRDGLELKVWSRLTDADSWVLLAPKSTTMNTTGHSLKCIMRIRPEFDRDNVFDTGDRRYKGRTRVGFIAWDWRGVHGSVGIG